MASALAPSGRFDRLGSTLFVAALAHGVVILGVTFAPEPPAPPSEMPSLNVTLLVDTASAETVPNDSDLLAARNQTGASSDDGDRPTRTLTAEHPRNQQGEPLGADAIDAEALEAATPVEQIVTQSQSDRQVEAIPDTTDTAAPVPMQSAALLQQVDIDTLAAEIDERTVTTRSDDGGPSGPSTREAAVSGYLFGWRQRVERVGTANFPLDTLSSGPDRINPIIKVTINAAGGLQEIVLQRPSGNSIVDQAALKILELAAPFEPLPESLLAEHDMLTFAYEWDFTTGPR